MTRAIVLLAVFAAALVTACGGGDKPAAEQDDVKSALESVKPISSARVSASLVMRFDNAPPEVGTGVDLRFEGPLRANGPGKLPSIDWKIDFEGLDTRFSSRIVSTGNNLFVRLGGADFEVGEDAIAQINRQASQNASGDGLAAIGIDPLAAVKDLRAAGESNVAGAPTTRSTGRVDLDKAIDQIERFLRAVPRRPAAGQSVPQLNLTAEQRAQVTQMFGAPRFEADIAADDTIRRMLLATRFTTPAANREAAGGITGGTIEYSVEYADVGREVTIDPVEGARPIEEFSAALQRELAK